MTIKIRKITLSLLVGALLGFTNLNSSSFAMDNQEDEYSYALNIIKKRNDDYNILKEKHEILKNTVENLKIAIKETDELVTYILNAGPTARSYLLAVASRAEENELNRLFKEAITGVEISNIMTGGTTSVRKEAFDSHVKLLEMTKLREHTQINEKFSTIEYSTLRIPKVSQEELIKTKEFLIHSQDRKNKKIYENPISPMKNHPINEIKKEENK